MKRKLSLISASVLMFNLSAFAADITYQGQVKVERFDGTGGGLPGIVTNTKFVNNQPDSVKFFGETGLWYNLEPDNVDNFGARVTGFITPTESGEYVFFTSADDNVAVYLSTDSTPANLKLIAADIGWQGARTWSGGGGQDNGQNPPWRRGDRLTGLGPYENRSDEFLSSPRVKGDATTAAGLGLPRGVPTATGADKPWPTVDANGNAVITLQANQPYYFQLIFGDGTGGGFTGLAWSKRISGEPLDVPAPGATAEIPTENLSVIFSDTLSFKTQPTNKTVLQGQVVNLVSEANGFPGGITYQWYDNGVAIDGATAGTYSIPAATIADHNGHKYKVVITSVIDSNKTLTSTEITLTVNNDTVGPAITKIITADTFLSAKVIFSESVSNEALDPANYVITGGTTPVTLLSPDGVLPAVSFVLVADVATDDPANPANPLNRQAVIILTSQQAEGAVYTLTVNNVKDLANNPMSSNTKQMYANVFRAGLLNYKRWNGPGNVPAVANDPLRLANPTVQETRTVAATGGQANTYVDIRPLGGGGNYVDRVDGFFIPTVTGEHVFLMSADNNGFTYLSTDADPAHRKLIAADVGWQNTAEWTGPGGDTAKRRGDLVGGGPFENRSDQFLTSARAASGNGLPGGAVVADGVVIEDGIDPEPWPTYDSTNRAVITLTNGVRYAFQLWHVEGDSGRAEVTYKMANEADPANASASRITSALIGAFVDPTSLLPTITGQPAIQNFTVGGAITFTVTGSSALPLTYQWYKNETAIAGQTGATLTINNATAADIGSYRVAVINENGTTFSNRAAALTPVTAPGLVFAESGGQVVVEGEHYFDARAATDGHVWVPLSGRADASGGAYVAVLPDSGANLGNTPNFATVARAGYKIKFTTTGTYYLWLRGGDIVADGAGDSVHAGLDDVLTAAGTQITGAPTFNTLAWNWVGANNAAARVTLDVTTAGEHTVHLWMREDGFLLDKVLLTTDSAFSPTGQGPAESPQVTVGPTISAAISGGVVTITYQGTLVSSSTPNGTYAPVAGATGGTYAVPAGSANTFFRSLQ